MKRRDLLTKIAGVGAGIFVLNKLEANPHNELKRQTNKVFYASQSGAKLDSNVLTGGGTDDTEVLQQILDMAKEQGGLQLVMDGAALIRGLNIHSNTTIECLNSSCGFFLKPGSDRSLLINANPAMSGERRDKNISLIGGTYNHNAPGQKKTGDKTNSRLPNMIVGLSFFGVENLVMRDVTISNQRTFAMALANWFRVSMENIFIDLPVFAPTENPPGRNQDGLHFFGPGQFLSLKNIRGRSGDDFIALTPDELDGVSGITDVIIDGVNINDAAQCIRMLSRDQGRLDRILVKNITGTYKSFGFFINPHRPGKTGNFGNIVFDTIDLRQTERNYFYTPPFLFRLNGTIESITFRNIFHHQPSDKRPVLEIGWPAAGTTGFDLVEDKHQRNKTVNIKSVTIDGLHIYENEKHSADASYIRILGKVDNMIVRNVEIVREPEVPQQGCLIETNEDAGIKNLFLNNIFVQRMKSLLLLKKGEINTLRIHNVMASEIDEAILSIEEGKVRHLSADSVHGAVLGDENASGKIFSIEKQ